MLTAVVFGGLQTTDEFIFVFLEGGKYPQRDRTGKLDKIWGFINSIGSLIYVLVGFFFAHLQSILLYNTK